MAKMGRPLKTVDWAQFESMCEIQCTQEEMSNVLKIAVEHLRNKARAHYGEEDFCAIIKKYADGGKKSLRRYQYAMAKDKPVMAIWLGKQWLGQRDDPKGQDEFNGDLKDYIEFLKTKYGPVQDKTVFSIEKKQVLKSKQKKTG